MKNSININDEQKLSNTFILPGTPINRTMQISTNEQIRTRNEEDQHERVSSSRLTNIFRRIRSSLPFFSSKHTQLSSVDIATTREHFIPVSIHLFIWSISNSLIKLI